MRTYERYIIWCVHCWRGFRFWPCVVRCCSCRGCSTERDTKYRHTAMVTASSNPPPLHVYGSVENSLIRAGPTTCLVHRCKRESQDGNDNENSILLGNEKAPICHRIASRPMLRSLLSTQHALTVSNTLPAGVFHTSPLSFLTTPALACSACRLSLATVTARA